MDVWKLVIQWIRNVHAVVPNAIRRAFAQNTFTIHPFALSVVWLEVINPPFHPRRYSEAVSPYNARDGPRIGVFHS